MANTFPTTSVIAKEVLAILENNLAFASGVNRDYQAEFTSNMARGYAPGQTINIKRPPRYTYRAGRSAVPQDSTQTTVPLTLSQGGTDLWLTSLERTLFAKNMEDYLVPALATVTNEIDRQGLQLARQTAFNTLNPTGALPNSQATALQAVTDCNTRLDEMAAPRDKRRSFIMTPRMNGAMIQGFAGLFNSSSKISEQFGSGMMVDSLGIAYAMDQNVDLHTNGAATATNINGANQTGSSITVVATAGGTLTKGTAITLPGVFAVNPQSRTSTGVLADFIVTADVLVGSTTIPISPAIVTSGPFQNVTASPTTAAPYVIKGAASTSYNANIAFHKDAFTLAMVPMDMPEAGMGALCAQESHKGLTAKVTKYYTGADDISNIRIDVLFGYASTYPELAVRYFTV
jgi:P22 coat protein - gene protein 5